MPTTSSPASRGSALVELKKWAKRLGKESGEESPDLQHKHQLATVARSLGFRDWQQARRVLSGEAEIGEDFGTLWIGRPGGGFLNEWFAHYQEAQASWQAQPHRFLLPYKTQFVIVEREMMLHLGIDKEHLADGLDLFTLGSREQWDELHRQRVRALRRAT